MDSSSSRETTITKPSPSNNSRNGSPLPSAAGVLMMNGDGNYRRGINDSMLSYNHNHPNDHHELLHSNSRHHHNNHSNNNATAKDDVIVVSSGSNDYDDEHDENDDDDDDDDDDYVNNSSRSNNKNAAALVTTTVCCCYSWLEYMWDAFGLPKFYQLMANWKILTYGQILSFLLAAGGAAQSAIYVNCHLNTPTTFTLGWVYFFLSWFLIPICRNYYNNNNKNSMVLVPNSDHDDDNGIQLSSNRNSPIKQQQQHAKHSRTITPTSSPHHNGDDDDDEMFDGSLDTNNNNSNHHQSRRNSLLEGPVWAYFCMAVLDVEANYFTVLAFQYTTLTSVTLFDALAIPSSMILSRMFLQRRYTNFHLLGVLLCMIGVLVNVFQDYDSDSGSGGGAAAAADGTTSRKDGGQELPHKLRGDILAITGGILYGFNDFLCELSVRHLGGPEEYLGMMGFFAFLVCMIQASIMERQQIVTLWDAIFHLQHYNNTHLQQHHQHNSTVGSRFLLQLHDESSSLSMHDQMLANVTCSGTTIGWVWVFYVLISVVGYIGAAHFLTISEAAFYNLSLLTGDLWSVAFSIVDEGIVPQPLFYLALFLISGGVLVYETAPSPIQDDDHTAAQQEIIAAAAASSSPNALRRDKRRRNKSMLRLIDPTKDEQQQQQQHENIHGDLELTSTTTRATTPIRIPHLRDIP